MKGLTHGIGIAILDTVDIQIDMAWQVLALLKPVRRSQVISPIQRKSEIKFDIKMWYNGAPGGWTTSKLAEVAMYSPQSQKLNVGSTVNE